MFNKMKKILNGFMGKEKKELAKTEKIVTTSQESSEKQFEKKELKKQIEHRNESLSSQHSETSNVKNSNSRSHSKRYKNYDDKQKRHNRNERREKPEGNNDYKRKNNYKRHDEKKDEFQKKTLNTNIKKIESVLSKIKEGDVYTLEGNKVSVTKKTSLSITFSDGINNVKLTYKFLVKVFSAKEEKQEINLQWLKENLDNDTNYELTIKVIEQII